MPLSDRIRPDCEAAPWVIKEVKEMESRIKFWIEKSTMQSIQISGMETEIQALKAENAHYREALEFYAKKTLDRSDDVEWLESDEYKECYNYFTGRRAREALKGDDNG